jgi:copper chaperone CopZ
MTRKWFAALWIAALAVGCATPENGHPLPEGTGIELSHLRAVVLTVHGLSCPLCANNLDGQLRRIEGVEEATIDLKTGAVSVRLGQGHSVSAGDLARAVKNAGFTLKKIEPREDAQE